MPGKFKLQHPTFYSAILIIVLSLTVSTYAEVLILQPGPEGKDTYTCDCLPNTNNPNGPVTMLYQGRYTVCSNKDLMQFDLSQLPDSVYVIYASLELYCIQFYGSQQGQMTYTLVTEPWNENTVTYYTLPAVNNFVQVQTGWPSPGDWLNVDVTVFLQAWTDGTRENYGIMGAYSGCSNTCDVQFASSDYSSSAYRPRLTIVYFEQSEVREITGAIADDFTFTGIHPNPFNSETSICFSIPSSEHVQMSVHNISGLFITTLIDGELSPGVYSQSFNGKGLPSGIYFVRLNAGNFNGVKKMILMK